MAADSRLNYIRRAAKSVSYRLLYPDLFDEGRQERVLGRIRSTTKGKVIAVVGNAESIFRRSDGAAIDRCDYVMRLNAGFIRNPESQGGRTEFVCVSSSLGRTDLRAAFGDAQIIFATPWRWNINKDLLPVRSSLAFYPLSAWRDLSNAISGRRPSTGLMAIDLCRNHFAAREIRLFGFDWKQSKTFYADHLSTHHHDWEAERRLVGSWAASGGVVLPPQ